MKVEKINKGKRLQRESFFNKIKESPYYNFIVILGHACKSLKKNSLICHHVMCIIIIKVNFNHLFKI